MRSLKLCCAGKGVWSAVSYTLITKREKRVRETSREGGGEELTKKRKVRGGGGGGRQLEYDGAGKLDDDEEKEEEEEEQNIDKLEEVDKERLYRVLIHRIWGARIAQSVERTGSRSREPDFDSLTLAIWWWDCISHNQP